MPLPGARPCSASRPCPPPGRSCIPACPNPRLPHALPASFPPARAERPHQYSGPAPRVLNTDSSLSAPGHLTLAYAHAPQRPDAAGEAGGASPASPAAAEKSLDPPQQPVSWACPLSFTPSRASLHALIFHPPPQSRNLFLFYDYIRAQRTSTVAELDSDGRSVPSSASPVSPAVLPSTCTHPSITPLVHAEGIP